MVVQIDLQISFGPIQNYTNYGVSSTFRGVVNVL